MKWSFLLFSSFLCLQAFAQYPATGNKMRLGWQTTGDGLVYRGAIGDTATLDPSGLNNAWMLLDTASGNLYAYRTKAWRLVSGGGGGGGVTMPFDSVTFNVNETDASLRELKYSEEKGYLQYGGQDSVQIPLLPGIWYVRNDTSVAIPKGTVLRATGTLGASGRIKVKHMIANGSIDAMYILGIAMQDIAVGADGYAMSQGKIRQVNTQAYSEGAVLYADVDTLGGLTQTEPTGSNLKLPIAFVVNSASNGTIAVRVTSGAYMRDLHDTEITSPVSNASLYYNSSEGIWRDTTAAALKSDISGTANYLAKFTGANTVGNSQLFDNGTNVGLGNTSPISGNGGGLTIGSPSAGRGLHLYTSGSGLFMYPSGSSNPSFQMGSSDADSSILYYTYFNYSHKFFTTNVERFRISHTGNVGIATSSPSRPLHVNANSSMIIPSGATGTRPASGANGDLRYSTTFNNIEFYDGSRGLWERPLVGTVANNKVAFASGDTLTSNTNFHWDDTNTRLGIGNAAPDSTLTVTGGGRFSGGVSARNYTLPTTGNRPALGMYSRIANRLSFAVNDTLRFEILAKGTASLTATTESPTAPAFALNVNGGGIQAKNYLTLNGDSLANSAPQITVLNQDIATSGGYVVFQKRRGSSGAGSVNYGAVVNGDELGTFAWGGKIQATGAGGGINASAGFRANVVGTVTDTFAPVDFTIFTSPRSDGSTSRVPVKTDRLTIKPSGRVGINTASPSATLHVNGNLSRNAPKTVTTAHTVDSLTNWIICDGTGAITLTLPTASSWTGREIMVKTIQPYAVNSASSNVVPIDGVAAGTPILPATDGAWCTLVSDGTNWIIMQRGS